jgi:hypothetical protein
MQSAIQNLIQTLSKNGRTTIDFTNEDDVSFFTPLLQEALKGKKVKAAKVVKADKDKKDLNSYMIFCAEARKNTEFPDNQPKAISRHLGEMWRALSAEKKAGYKQQADANKRSPNSRTSSPQRASSPPADSGKPKKPLTSYIKFSNAMRDSVKGTVTNPQDVSRRLGEMWRALTEEEKVKWKGDDSVEPVAADEKVDEKVVEKEAVVEEESPKKAKEEKSDEDVDVEETPKKKSKKEKSDEDVDVEETPKKKLKKEKSEGAPKKSKKADSE